MKHSLNFTGSYKKQVGLSRATLESQFKVFLLVLLFYLDLSCLAFLVTFFKIFVFMPFITELAKIKKKISKKFSKTNEKSIFDIILKIFEILFSSRKCLPFCQNSIFWASDFCKHPYLIVLIDLKQKTLGYRMSCGVTF